MLNCLNEIINRKIKVFSVGHTKNRQTCFIHVTKHYNFDNSLPSFRSGLVLRIGKTVVDCEKTFGIECDFVLEPFKVHAGYGNNSNFFA